MMIWTLSILASLALGDRDRAPGTDQPGAQPAPTAAPAAQTKSPPIKLGPAGAMTIRARVGECDKRFRYDYDVVWGPHPRDGRAFEGELILSPDPSMPPTINLKRGYVYIAGRLLKQRSTASAQAAAPTAVSGPPVITTAFLEATAEGRTVLVVEAGVVEHKVQRLSPWTSGEVAVSGRTAGGGSEGSTAERRLLKGASAQLVGFGSQGRLTTEVRPLREVEEEFADVLAELAEMWDMRHH